MAQEKNFENRIKKYLESHGAWFVKFFANAYTKKGIPDILACVNGYFLAIEVKASNGKPSELQKYHVKKITRSNGCAVVLYPKDFEIFEKIIAAMLEDDLGYAEILCANLNRSNEIYERG